MIIFLNDDVFSGHRLSVFSVSSSPTGMSDR